MKRGAILLLYGTNICGSGGPDPRLNTVGSLDFCLGQYIA